MIPEPAARTSFHRANPFLRRPLIAEAFLWVALFGVILTLAGRGLGRAPFFLNADEPGKVEQIHGDWRNFNHPLLVINTVSLVTKWAHDTPSRHEIVVVGRACSLVAGALAAMVVGLTVRRMTNLPAGLVTTAWAASSPDLLDLQRLFKEETALALGLALVMLALILYQLRPSWPRLLTLGFACGLAASSKYIGALALLPAACGVLVGSSQSPRILHLIGLIAMAAALFGLVNLEAITTNRSRALKSLESEVAILRERPRSPRAVPHAFVVESWVNRSGIAAAPLLLVTAFLRRSRGASIPLWPLWIFPLCYAVLLTLSKQVYPRYYIVLDLSLAVIAGTAMGRLIPLAKERNRQAAAVLVICSLAMGIGFRDRISEQRSLLARQGNFRGLPVLGEARVPRQELERDFGVGIVPIDDPADAVQRLRAMRARFVLVDMRALHNRHHRPSSNGWKSVQKELFTHGRPMWPPPREEHPRPPYRLFRLEY